MQILTFKQWDQEKRRHLSSKYGVTLAELRRIYGPNHFSTDWWQETVAAYEAGTAFTTTQWNKLTNPQQWQILRSRRALKMPSSQHYPWKVPADQEAKDTA